MLQYDQEQHVEKNTTRCAMRSTQNNLEVRNQAMEIKAKEVPKYPHFPRFGMLAIKSDFK